MPADIAEGSDVVVADLMSAPLDVLSHVAEGRDVLVCCAGHVEEGEPFVALVDRVVSAVESVPASARPLCWFLAGAALLDLDATGRRALDVPQIRDVFWPHRANFERLSRSSLEWSLLCPGPMVDHPAVGLDRLRITTDRVPIEMPPDPDHLSPMELIPNFIARLPEMIVPYADAAAVMLAHVSRGGSMSRKRVGLALPIGMQGKKDQWRSGAGAGRKRVAEDPGKNSRDRSRLRAVASPAALAREDSNLPDVRS
jgi:hypothetical protein